MKNFKKVLALVLVLATLMGFATVAGAAYKDEDQISADYSEAIQVLELIETMEGYPDGTFGPKKTITREEAAKLIAIFDNKDADISTYYTSINPFADEKGRWGESYVGYGYRAGIIAGMNATTYAPTANVTGTQFLKMALVTLGYDQEAEGFVGSSWAVNVLALAKKIGLIDDLADGWKPENDLTREEAAQILLNTLKAETVEYAQEAKAKEFNPGYDSKTGNYTYKGKLYLTVAGAVKTGTPLYKDFDLKVSTSYDAFYRPYTKWTKDDDSVEIMEAPKATFTTKFNACDLLAELGVEKTDTDKEVVIDYVINNGEVNNNDPLMVGNKYKNSSYKLSENYTARPAGMAHLSHDSMILDSEFGIWSHTYSNCNLEGYDHGAQGTLTQVFYNGKDSEGNKHYYVVSIDTWLAKVGTVTKKTTARDEHLRSEGSVKFAAVYDWDTAQSSYTHGDAHGFLSNYCNDNQSQPSDGRFDLDGQCAKLDNTITYDDPTGLAKDDYVLITYSFKAKGNGYEGVQSVDVVEGKEGRLSGWINEKAGADPTSTRIDSEYVKDAVHFHLGYGLSKTDKYDTYTFYYDAYGNVIGMTDAEDTSSWGVLDGAYITYTKGTAALNVEVVGLDAKINEGTAKKAWGIAKFDDMTAADIIAQELLNAAGENDAWDGENRKAFKPAYDHLFKITTDSEGAYTIATSNDVKKLFGATYADYGTANWSVKVTKDQPYIEGEQADGTYEQLKGLRMTSDTKILVHKMDGTYASYEGYKNVDSLIAHYGEYVLSDDGKTIDVLYLCDNVYMTDGKFTAFVGKGLKNKTLEMNDETYWALTVYVNGDEDTVYLTDYDAHQFQGDNGEFVKGFYEMQYVEVDGVKTVKILKGPHDSVYTDIDEELNWTKTIVDMTDEWIVLYKNDGSKKELTVDFASDCAFYTIEDDSSKVLEKVTIDDVLDVYDYAASKGQKKIAYVSYNNDGDVNALYVILNETY